MARSASGASSFPRPYQSGSGAIVIGLQQLERLKRGALQLAKNAQNVELADRIGQQQEDSARRRIRETKSTPSGTKWKPWSKGHAATRGAHHSLLVESGALADSLTHYVVNPLEVQVGSNLVYAAPHLYGSEDGRIPARPFLDAEGGFADTDGGFADAHDREEIRDILRDAFRLRLL
jgi:phage virion morphogenesis protein